MLPTFQHSTPQEVEDLLDYEKSGLNLHCHECLDDHLDSYGFSDVMQVDFVRETGDPGPDFKPGPAEVDEQMAASSLSLQSMFEPLRLCIEKRPPKRFHRTFWRSITRRMLAGSKCKDISSM